MTSIDRMITDGTFETLSKRERLQVTRQRAKLEKNLGSIVDLTRLPAAIFVVDVLKEHIAVKEAKRLNIPVFAMVDTNSSPKNIDFIIPSNDDATKSISLIVDVICDAIKSGLDERKNEKDKEAPVAEKKTEKKAPKKEFIDEAIDEDKVEIISEDNTKKDPLAKKAPAKKAPAKKPAAKKE